MKARIFFILVIVTGLFMWLALAASAQGPDGAAPEQLFLDNLGTITSQEEQYSRNVVQPNLSATTVITGVTATYLPIVSRNYHPYLFYFEGFGDPDSGWYIGDSDSLKAGYVDDEYQVHVKNAVSGVFFRADLELPSDYRLEVDAREISNNKGYYGLLFGLGFDSTSFEGYQLIIYPDQKVFLLMETALGDNPWEVLVDWTENSAINSGAEMNHIQIDRIGSKMHIFFNGQYATTFDDNTLNGAGRDIGLRVYSGIDAGADVRFDNLQVSTRFD